MPYARDFEPGLGRRTQPFGVRFRRVMMSAVPETIRIGAAARYQSHASRVQHARRLARAFT